MQKTASKSQGKIEHFTGSSRDHVPRTTQYRTFHVPQKNHLKLSENRQNTLKTQINLHEYIIFRTFAASNLQREQKNRSNF